VVNWRRENDSLLRSEPRPEQLSHHHVHSTVPWALGDHSRIGGVLACLPFTVSQLGVRLRLERETSSSLRERYDNTGCATLLHGEL
jgi:hypothetical protein